MYLTNGEVSRFRSCPDDTLLHIRACQIADDEAFRWHGTDSISDYHLQWPRWQAIYNEIIAEVYLKAA